MQTLNKREQSSKIMGNCLVTQEEVIKVMKTDGKVLEYKAPIKVHEVLSDFAGNAISDRLPVTRHLQPDDIMVSNHLYYLLPIPKLSERRREKKRVRFAVPEAETCQGGGVVRIKLVITKQELEIMLRGGVSIDDMLSRDQDSSTEATESKPE